MKTDKKLNIFFSVDRNYIIPFTVALTSLLENNKGLNISVYVLYEKKNQNLLKNIEAFISEKYFVNLNLLEIEPGLFIHFPISDYISRAAYFRLIIANIIPVNIEYGLYLDCDIVVTGSLNELLNNAFVNNNEDYYLLAVSDKGEPQEIERFQKSGIQIPKYFNSGVMLLNLKTWRTNNTSKMLLETAEKYKKMLKWHDQDVLNIYFKNKWGTLNDTYNKFVDKKLSELPKIIHFSGSSKPWHYLNSHPYKSLYWKYLNLTPFKDEKFESVTIKKVLQKYRGKLKRSANLISHKVQNNY